MTIKIARPRIFRSQKDIPLTLDQIRSCAPAVFQENPYEGMSKNYAYIPTHSILTVMLDAGFTVHEVAQARPYRTDRDPYAKHMLRLRFPIKAKVGEVVPELVLVNAHDGTARYYLFGGLYRFICANGMVVGDTFMSIVVAHRGGDITRSRVLDGSYEIVEKEFPKIMIAQKKMAHYQTNDSERGFLANMALALRYPGNEPPFKAEQLLAVRREEDRHDDLWHVLNRIQENVMLGGFESRSTLFARRTTIRPVERVSNRVSINRGLWDGAMTVLQG